MIFPDPNDLRSLPQPGKSIILHFFVDGSSSSSPQTGSPIPITLHETTAQDLLLDLGPPLRKWWKEDRRVKDVWAGGGNGGVAFKGGVGEALSKTKTEEGGSEVLDEYDDDGCWWNYFQHGIDFLVGEGTGKVIKVLMHSNIVSICWRYFISSARDQLQMLISNRDCSLRYSPAQPSSNVMPNVHGSFSLLPPHPHQ